MTSPNAVLLKSDDQALRAAWARRPAADRAHAVLLAPTGWCDHLSGHIDGPASVIEVTEPGREL